jgi:shikimate kinase
MIIWLNGTFGAGKTTTAKHLAGRLASARHFDGELVGYLLMAALSDHEFRDFQDLPPWRELTQGFERIPLDIFHVLLHVDSDALAERIKADQVDAGACQWRLDHIAGYEKSRPWMESAADLVIDATSLPAADVAERIAKEAEKRIAETGQPG